MSVKNTARKIDDVYMDHFHEFRDRCGRAVRMEEVAKWIHDNQLIPDPHVDPVKLHVRKLKQAARKKRIRDLKGRVVREVVAVKIEKMTAGGQKILDVMWDYLHEMSLDNSLTHFDQRDQNITKQRLAATRDMESCLDFNPNVAGCRGQFVFGFIMEEAARPAVAETIEESPIVPIAVSLTDAIPERQAELSARSERSDDKPR